jgi:hypothetical protein
MGTKCGCSKAAGQKGKNGRVSLVLVRLSKRKEKERTGWSTEARSYAGVHEGYWLDLGNGRDDRNAVESVEQRVSNNE